MRSCFYLYCVEVIKGKHRGFWPQLLRAILYPFSLLFSLAVYVRNWAYDHAILEPQASPIPVTISIGNIIAGGTGKTPLTILLAQALSDRYKVAIVARGEGVIAATRSRPTLVANGSNIVCSVEEAGDEPYLIAKRVPHAIVIAGKNRYRAAELAHTLQADILLLDDAMQHRQLARDLDLVLVSGRDPFGGGLYLPRGLLRESPEALSRANLIILTQIESDEQYEELELKLFKYTHAAVIGTTPRITSIYDYLTGAKLALQGRNVGLFSTIAYPEFFAETILKEGAEIVAEYHLPDHASFSYSDLKAFALTCIQKKASLLVCTEKDMVKLSNMALPLPIAVVQIDLSITYGIEHWNKLIEKIELLQHMRSLEKNR